MFLLHFFQFTQFCLCDWNGVQGLSDSSLRPLVSLTTLFEGKVFEMDVQLENIDVFR